MADLLPLIKKIDTLRAELDSFKPLKQEDNERLWRKFRLEWNFNSNHIEGNTLTYGQTELLLIFDKTTGDHEMREYEEMKAHDVAIKIIQEYARDSTRALTEADVRELNKIILVRPYWGNAQTPDGQPTRKEIMPGEYKKQPNSVRLQNGEMFHYASPEETPAKMAELMEWYRKAESEKKLHPLQLAAKIHYDFVRIHPFDDSNGRTSRLLMNYVLLRHGFPPVIIKSADKKNYLTALNKADTGDFESFVEYVSKELIWSLAVSLSAAKGESIEEKDDLYKEIDVWSKELIKAKKEHVKSVKLVKELFDNSLNDFVGEYIMTQKEKFDGNFVYNNVKLEIDDKTRVKGYLTIQDMEAILFEYLRNPELFPKEGFNKWRIIYERHTLKDFNKADVFVSSILEIDFKPLKYGITHNQTLLIDRPYSKPIIKSEIRDLVWICISETFEEIKSKSKFKS
jgi:Fic family protein